MVDKNPRTTVQLLEGCINEIISSLSDFSGLVLTIALSYTLVAYPCLCETPTLPEGLSIPMIQVECLKAGIECNALELIVVDFVQLRTLSNRAVKVEYLGRVPSQLVPQKDI